MPTADAPNMVSAVDFQFDATSDGRPIKIASIIDEHTRKCLGGLVDRSITADVLIDELTASPPAVAIPACCAATTAPNSPATRWPTGPANASDWPSSRPPTWRNGYIESFNARVRDECLNINTFWSLAHARVVITDWKEEYNHHRRHSALGYQAPASFAAVCTHR